MAKAKLLTIFINLIGGSAVLGSYVWGFQSRLDAADLLWGGVPENIRPAYTVGMVLAAVGYFLFSYLILLRLIPAETHIAGRWGYGTFNLLYAVILVPSALWLPLTYLAVDQASPTLVWLVRLDLALVALASLGLLFSLLWLQPRHPRGAYRLAILGLLGFCFQTVLLDAIVWGASFGV